MKRARRQQGKPAFDLIEEAVHLLRTAPPAALAAYYLGAVPFVLGFLFFWAGMSRSPFACLHLSNASFGIAVLFFWMKFCQTLFARRLRAQIAAENIPPMNFRDAAKICFTQSILQPLGLFLIPLSLLPLLPFAWVYAFFQNATALGAGDGGGLSKFLNKSWRQAALWPTQNNVTLAIMLGFGFYVFLNWTTVCLVLPDLFKMLFGIESAFSKSPSALLNSTFFAAMLGLTYLCVDPILKTIFVLRCFYGESLQSGEDLKAELKPFAISQKIAAAILISLALFLASPARGDSPKSTATTPAGQKISPADLDKAINQTIHERKYVWRMPREKIVGPDSQEGIFGEFFDAIGQTLRQWARDVSHWLDELLRKLFPRQPVISTSADSSGYGWIESVEILLYGLLAVVVAALAAFLFRVWRNRGKSPAAVPAQAIFSTPDILDENVGADQMPEDGWTQLARELLDRGEFRLAMRAFYLASLSHLAARNLIRIARFKSNRDYERELRRRAHAFPNLLSIFGDNISILERIWYGMHEVNRDLVNQFSANVERIKAGG